MLPSCSCRTTIRFPTRSAQCLQLLYNSRYSTAVAALPYWMANACAILANFKAFSFPVNTKWRWCLWYTISVLQSCIPELASGTSPDSWEVGVKHEAQQRNHLCLRLVVETCEGGLSEVRAGAACLGGIFVGETFVAGAGWWMVGCWSMNCNTICVSSSRSCWGCQSTSDSMTTVTHSLVSPITTLIGFSNPPLGLTSPEEMRFWITFRSRFLRVVFPTRGGPVNKHLRDLCLIFLWCRYFSSNLSSCKSVSIEQAEWFINQSLTLTKSKTKIYFSNSSAFSSSALFKLQYNFLVALACQTIKLTLWVYPLTTDSLAQSILKIGFVLAKKMPWLAAKMALVSISWTRWA